MEKIKLTQAVIVEGKYDKIHLESMVDALILSTDGFRIFKDKEMRKLIKALAHSCGIVIVTDADAAGFKIRAHLSDIARGGTVTQVYIPDLPGKERRKARPGKEGKLGVEGIDTTQLREAFARAGLLPGGENPAQQITRQDLYRLGLSGGPSSSLLRRGLAKRLELPARLSTSAWLPVLSRLVTLQELEQLVAELEQQLG